MSGEASAIRGQLPSLRRFARSLTGSQEAGDRLVAAALELILADMAQDGAGEEPRILLHRVLLGLWRPAQEAPASGWGASGPDKLERHIRALPPFEREALLLASVSEFSPSDVARALGVSRDEAEGLVARARANLNAQTATRVLIIEDEPIIAFDLASIVTSMGHRVVGTADTRRRAVELARAGRPGIVLADIQLRDGSSGIEAAREIVEEVDVPVIFITAFPERLLTGAPTEPAYLVTKPFDAEALQVTIAQALLMHPAPPEAAAPPTAALGQREG
ncbi:MAG TPA: response regulator [Paracoccaceae bacterium]|nr:response regulator [Paracoccaceae bacterium]